MAAVGLSLQGDVGVAGRCRDAAPVLPRQGDAWPKGLGLALLFFFE